jgi:hypothetical protein
VFTYGHRLRVRCFQATTKSGDGSQGIPPTATSWGRGGAYQAGGETICKAPSRFGRTLPSRRESGSRDHEAEILAGDDPKREMRTQSQNHNNLPGSLTEQHTRSQQKTPPPACRRSGVGKYKQVYSIATRWPRKVSSKGTWMVRRPESNLAFA